MGQKAKPTRRPYGILGDLDPYPAHCSFCFKAQDAAKRLVAGPGGVFICDACVAVGSALVAGRGATMFALHAPFETLETARLLALIQPLDATLRRKNGQLRRLVDTLRARKVSWAKIGEALGISRQSAWERFSKPMLAAKPWRPLPLPAEADRPPRDR